MEDYDTHTRFSRLLSLCDELFADEAYEASYHVLMAGLHVAEGAGDPALLAEVGARASRHRDHVNRRSPEHPFSDASAVRRGGRAPYETLELRVASLELSWRLDTLAARSQGRSFGRRA